MKVQIAVVAFLLMASAAPAASAQITGTFVPAVDGVNSFQSSDGVSVFSSTSPTPGLWHDRVGVFDIVGLPSPLSGAYQGQASTSNEVVTTITGLVPGQPYDIGIICGIKTDINSGNQHIDAGFTSGALITYLEANSTQTGDILMATGWLVAEHSIGSAMADASGEIAVYVNYTAGAERSVYNGLAYTAANPTNNYCVAAVNDTGFPAVISTLGSTSLAANDLTLRCGPVGANQPGIYFFSDTPAAGASGIPFGEGNRCVVGSLVRLLPPVFESGGFLDRPVDYNNLPSGVSITAGDTLHFQGWYRDTNDNNGDMVASGFNLSDAITITFLP